MSETMTEKEMTMTEKEINEMVEQLPPPPVEIPIEFVEIPIEFVEIPIEFVEGKKRTRKAQPLKWYERQYSAGFISGFWIGVIAGLPIAMLLAAICKWFMDWLLGV